MCCIGRPGYAIESCPRAVLEQCGTGGSASDASVARKSLFLTVIRVFWVVTPKLEKSLQADCNTRTSAVKHAIACIEDLLDTIRPRPADGRERWARRYTSIHNADVPLVSHASILCATMLLEVTLHHADVSAYRRMYSAGRGGYWGNLMLH